MSNDGRKVLAIVLLLSAIMHRKDLQFYAIFAGGAEPGRTGGGRGGYGRREKKGRKAGFLRWREAGEKFKKASFHYLLLLTASQRNEPNNVS